MGWCCWRVFGGDEIKHYLNVCNINGAEIEPVDVITFGSPCQDMSVAGKREGIKHSDQGDEETTRSGLFYEAVRIIKEMREATNEEYPKYAVWENVPGAFSSNKGRDFHAVLEALCSVCDDAVSIPEPYDAKRTKLVWNKAGEVVGNNYSVAWRTLDAQYWGVPQRRKRIYLVADFTGRCAGKILFKQDGLRGNMQTSNEAGQGVTADAMGGVDGGVGVECIGFDMYNQASTDDKTRTLKTPAGGDDLPVVCVLSDQGGSSINVENEGTSPTLRANSHQHEPAIAFEPGAMVRDMGNRIWTEQSPTLRAKMGDNQPAVCFDRATFNQGINAQYDFEVSEEGVVSTVVAKGPSGVCYGSTIPINTMTCQGRPSDNGRMGIGVGELDDPANTISAAHCHAVCFEPGAVENKRKYIIRRLTPTECARLQGFPDWWSTLAPYNPADAEFWEDVRKTYAEINGKKYKPVKDIKKWYDKLHTDSAEYKMWGNGIALPNAEYVMRGIASQGAKTLGSLFDGSGGFPLAGVLNGITPLWSSEIEPYPIAVTVSRFGIESAPTESQVR